MNIFDISIDRNEAGGGLVEAKTNRTKTSKTARLRGWAIPLTAPIKALNLSDWVHFLVDSSN